MSAKGHHSGPIRESALPPALGTVPRANAGASPPLFTSSDQTRTIGVAHVASADSTFKQIYVCDPLAHSIHVLDQHRRPMFSFGGFGSRFGQLDTPTDVAIVWTEPVEPAMTGTDVALLAVADRGNHRVQLFELDGAPIGAIGDLAGGASPGRWPIRTGWPFFRLDSAPPLPSPTRLEWRCPYLDVACGGTMVRLDLGVALLPDFNTWIAEAPVAVLWEAFRRFTGDRDLAGIPDSCLFEIAERLQPGPCGAVDLSPPGHG
jgi:hypothetical protein